MGRLNPKTLQRLTVLLLIIGFGSAIFIFFTAQPEVRDPLLGDPMDSKKYVRQMKEIGGAANLVAAEASEWFKSIWHGRALAFTVAVLTVGVTLAFRFVAKNPELFASNLDESNLPPPPAPRARK